MFKYKELSKFDFFSIWLYLINKIHMCMCVHIIYICVISYIQGVIQTNGSKDYLSYWLILWKFSE